MRSIQSWLEEYGESHRNPINKRFHWVCVPLVMLALVLLFAAIPRPAAFAPSPWMHWGTVLIIVALLYYFALAPRLALGVVVVGAALIFATWGIGFLPWSVAISGAVLFVVSWIGQFIGHHYYEGNRPAFLKNVQFLMIGPLWLLSWVYKRFGWRIA
ncbi:MAG: DUF962 domain-containing protein [Gammaproteobacteria bacterium]